MARIWLDGPPAEVRMVKVLVEERERQIESDVVTWGDLLARLDGELATSGRAVTAARFDGDDEPAFRTPGAAARALGAFTLIEVQARTPEDLLQQTLAAAGDAILEFAAACITLAGQFRGRVIAPANQGLAELSQGVSALLGIIQAAADVRGVDLDELLVHGRSAKSTLVELGSNLERLLAAQGTRDWLRVADVLEHDLEPVVRRFFRIVEMLARNRER